MKDLEFGLIMALAGMGVTILTLYLLTLIIQFMNRIFPDTEKKEIKK
jgi:Na+-transporting methylmalonyl-CoA/oxaloacetate decarboxylase gamma subunit